MKIFRKIRSALENPEYIRCLLFGIFKYFPVSRVTNEELKKMPIYCISLKNAVERRRFMEKQVVNTEFDNFCFFDAIDASKINIEEIINSEMYNDKLAKTYHNRSLNKGEIACSLSHGKVYEKIIDKGHDMALILEDDALFMTKRINMINFRVLPLDWDILFLSSFYSCRPPKGKINNNLFTTESWEGSCAAYIVSQKGASKLAKAYKPVIHAADGFVGRCMELPEGTEHAFKQQGAATKIKAYLIYPDPILNGSSVGFWKTSLPNIF